MAHGFRREGEMFTARFNVEERAVVAGLMEQVAELVAPVDIASDGTGDAFDQIVAGFGDGLGTNEEMPQVPDSPEGLGGRGFGTDATRDPALDRLFPTGNRQDEQAAAEFRRLTEHGLRTRKSRNLRIAIKALRESDDLLRLTEGEAVAMLVALTDVRLVLGERLGLQTDEDAERLEEAADHADPEDPLVYALAMYDFLTWMQETLAQSLTRPS